MASASPRRKELLAQVIDRFEILPSAAEEKVEGKPEPESLVKLLAAQKAAEVAARAGLENKAVLGADTIVTVDCEILGKPQNEGDAFRMLRMLSGRAHEVWTGVCVLFPEKEGQRERLVAADCTKVYFNALTDEEIRAYIATGSPMDKAGAYGIQDGGLVEKIEGSFSNVVGLPVELLQDMLKNV